MVQATTAQAARNLKAWKKLRAPKPVVHNHRVDYTIGGQLLMKQGVKAVDAAAFIKAIDGVKEMIK